MKGSYTLAIFHSGTRRWRGLQYETEEQASTRDAVELPQQPFPFASDCFRRLLQVLASSSL